MASLIPGYEYDIFISYRQKDNKYDGWVTEFVDNLKRELEATFKEDISVYFDINPHDGLLETHDVDASLKEKLRCLIFIPVISRTYCDPKSFAWEHEFKAFIDQASQDQFGLKVKLPNGNVASRVLPVRIHELDPEDVKLYGSVLGGVMRGVEFIYKSAGINRPLLPKEENPLENQNRTNYRDQINKLANAVREIIYGLKYSDEPADLIQPEGSKEQVDLQEEEKIIDLKKRRIGIAVIVVLILFVGSLLLFQFVFKNNKEAGEKSIAVLPFRNLSNDTTQLYFCDGFTEEILNNLQKVKSFTVRSRTSSDKYRGTKKIITEIGKELNVNYLVEGSVGREGNNLKIWVQLIDSKKDKHLWSDDYLKEINNAGQIYSLQSEIARDISAALKTILSPGEIQEIEKKPTENLEAYNYYLLGNNYLSKYNLTSAFNLYSKAIREDPSFTDAYARRARIYLSLFWTRQGNWENYYIKAQEDITKGLETDPESYELRSVLAFAYYINRDFVKALNILEDLKKEAPKMAELYQNMADVFRRQGKWEKSITEREIAVQLDPYNWMYLTDLASTYRLLRQYDKQVECYRQGSSLIPDMDFSRYLFNAFLNITGNLEVALKESEVKEEDVQYWIFYYTRQYDELIELISKGDSIYTGLTDFQPKTFRFASIYYLNGNKSLCKTYADSAVVFLKKRINETPEDERLYATLGKAYALLGNANEAIKYGEKAVELMPVKLDAFQGSYMEKNLMEIYIFSKNYDLAIEKIEYLFSIPSDIHLGNILLDPIYDKLRNLPGFKKIIDSARKQTR